MNLSSANPSANLQMPLLTDSDYHLMRALLPHNVDVRISVWAKMLSRILDRHIGTDAAQLLITEYNTRLAQEFA